MNKRQAENIARDFWIKCYNAQDRDGDYSEIEKECIITDLINCLMTKER